MWTNWLDPALLNTVHCMDCLEFMKTLPDKCIDLICVDPPYFWVVKNDWDNQWETKQDFINWIELFTIEWKRILKDNWSLYIFWDDKIIAYIQVMMDKYFKLENNIVWYKPNNTVQKWWSWFNMYAPMTERLLFYSNEIVNINWICVNNTREYIRNEILKAKWKIVLKEINQALWVADNWWWVASAVLSLEKTEPVMITEEHYYKLREWLNWWKEYEFLRKEYEELRRPFNPADNFWDVWILYKTNQSEFVWHPTQKPKQLITRIIETSSRKWDIILDCFAWSWTTGVACKELWRNYILVEKEPKYVDIIHKRLQNTTVSLFHS